MTLSKHIICRVDCFILWSFIHFQLFLMESYKNLQK